MIRPDEILWARWDEIDALLSEALERPSPVRHAFVREAAAGDDELRDIVLRLLDRVATGSKRANGPAEAVVAGAFGGESRADVDLAANTVVGRYRILRRRARGGMATVYEAERADGTYEQRVALKVLRRGLDTDDLVRRFRTERQILSSLSHPHIARLLDGGATPDGRPYLVMELVEGDPITTYADARRLDLTARLELFLQVADAVHAAHRQLVVHRDIKPSNILVDADGVVKLLDFGIAKLLAAGGEHTSAESRALTPDYASPEQVRGGAITTATDVYQLGLLLRELLTGIRPLAGDADTANHALRASRLAARPIAAAATPDERAVARATTPSRLARALAGDLDVIIARALRTDPEHRYASADEMASDVRRHLAGLPIVAHPESRAYRLRKFVRRNPWAAAAAALALVAGLGYVLTVTAHSRRVAAERDRAAQEALKAQQVTDFLVRLFESADPNESQGAQVTARALLERGAARLDEELAGEPLVRAAMRSAIGRSFHRLGLPMQAAGHLARAVEERRGSNDSVTARDVADDLSLLAQITAATDWRRSLALFGEALALAEESSGPRDPLVAKIFSIYAPVLALIPDSAARARALRDSAVAILRAAPGDHRAELAQALTASAYGRSPSTALPRMREALDLRRSLYGDVHDATASSLSDLALATANVDPVAADSLMRQALATFERLHGRRHPSTLLALNNLAGLRRDRGAYAEAIPLYREVLALRRELYPENLTSHAFALYGLGLSLAEVGDAREAEGLLREALALLRRSQHPDSPLISLASAGVGYALARQHRFTEAESLLVGGSNALEEMSSGLADRLRTVERVIWMYRAWGRYDAAAPHERKRDSLAAAIRRRNAVP